jgi:protein-S-isoprenylcysteine O-methyltransferase Ste14
MSRALAFAYAVVCYLAFLASYVYLIGFVGNFIVPTTIDGGPSTSTVLAVAVNLGLILVFGLQHSVMARPAFKRVWTKIVPKPLERSTYVLISSIALFALCWFWQPVGGTVWHVENPIGRAILYMIFAAGWLIVPGASLLINHFDLFGLRQAWLFLRGERYTHLKFRMPGPYKYVRHPLYIGWLLAFWATPDMTIAHLLFALGLTGYILIAIRYEERDLATFHGEAYIRYRERTPMFVPNLTAARTNAQAAESESGAA